MQTSADTSEVVGFTPGPWSAVQFGDEHIVLGRPTWQCKWHGQEGRWEVAVCDSMMADEYPSEAKANARLIAAAPELYAALALGLEYWAHRQQRYKNRHPAWVVAARAALAKARGQ